MKRQYVKNTKAQAHKLINAGMRQIDYGLGLGGPSRGEIGQERE